MKDGELDIFRPHIVLKRIKNDKCDAGTLDFVGGGSGASNDLTYSANGGAPFQSVFNEGMKVALALQIPYWFEQNWDKKILIYHPDADAMLAAWEAGEKK